MSAEHLLAEHDHGGRAVLHSHVHVHDGAVHNDVSTTMIYTHVLNRGPGAVESPVDRMFAR